MVTFCGYVNWFKFMMNDTLCDRLKSLEANFEWRNVLQRNLFGLCKYIEPDNGLIDHLTGTEVLNRKAAESFRVILLFFICRLIELMKLC